jgi:hypothetical protein
MQLLDSIRMIILWQPKLMKLEKEFEITRFSRQSIEDNGFLNL